MWGQRLAQQCGEAFSGGLPILSLGAVFFGGDGEYRTRESCGEPVDNAVALDVVQGSRRRYIEAELDA